MNSCYCLFYIQNLSSDSNLPCSHSHLLCSWLKTVFVVLDLQLLAQISCVPAQTLSPALSCYCVFSKACICLFVLDFPVRMNCGIDQLRNGECQNEGANRRQSLCSLKYLFSNFVVANPYVKLCHAP